MGPALIPTRSIRVLEGSVKPVPILTYNALVERVQANLAELPSRVTVGVSVVIVACKGRALILVANFSSRDVYLNPRTSVAALSTFDLEPPFEFVSVVGNHVCVREVKSAGAVTQNNALNAILSRMDVGDLTASQQEHLRQDICKYQSIFSVDEDDLGLCDLIKQKIVTTEEDQSKFHTGECTCTSGRR